MGRPGSCWCCGTTLLLVMILMDRLEGATSNRCSGGRQDSRLTATADCKSTESGLSGTLSLMSPIVFENVHYHLNCSGGITDDIHFAYRASTISSNFSVDNTRACSVSGCVTMGSSFFGPATILLFGTILCMEEDPLHPESVTPSPTISVKTSSSMVIGDVTSSSAVIPTLTHSANPMELQKDGAEKGSLLVVLTPVILTCVALLLLFILLTIVWYGCSWKKKHSYLLRREALNKLFCGPNYADTNIDHSFIFVRVVAPTTIPHSPSLVTLLEGLCFERNSTTTVKANQDNHDNEESDFNPLSDVGYVNDGMHPMSFSEENKGEGTHITYGANELRQMRRLSNDDVFLPGVVKTTSTGRTGSCETACFIDKSFRHITSDCNGGDNSSRRYFHAEDRKDGRLRHCHPEDQTYVDYNKIIQASFPSTGNQEGGSLMNNRPEERNTVGEDRYSELPVSTTNTCSKSSSDHAGMKFARQTDITSTFNKNTYYYDSNDIMILLTDTPPPDDSGFKSHGDALSMISV